jgi:hypothetical protein
MALIDITELLTDPDYASPIAIVTRVPSVNFLGENYLNETTKMTWGCVEPANGKSISRLPESLRVSNLMSFWIRGVIVTSEPEQYPAILLFKGNRFQVKIVFDWSGWGSGWSEGLCVAQAIAP